MIMETVGSVFNLAESFLKKGGNFVCKVLESEAEPLLDVPSYLSIKGKLLYLF
jgi:23S rRNA U2552 (ribose-2'-O)-methylase RlmE/FtsJ